jgi:hypothetical protein
MSKERHPQTKYFVSFPTHHPLAVSKRDNYPLFLKSSSFLIQEGRLRRRVSIFSSQTHSKVFSSAFRIFHLVYLTLCIPLSFIASKEMGNKMLGRLRLP